MVHKCSSSNLPTIQVLRHKLFPEQEKHDFTQTRKHEKYLAALGALAHRLQCRTACKIQNQRQGVPKWRTGSGKIKNQKRAYAILEHF